MVQEKPGALLAGFIPYDDEELTHQMMEAVEWQDRVGVKRTRLEDTPMEAAVGWDKESILKMYGVIASPPKRRCLRKEDSVVSVASSAVRLS